MEGSVHRFWTLNFDGINEPILAAFALAIFPGMVEMIPRIERFTQGTSPLYANRFTEEILRYQVAILASYHSLPNPGNFAADYGMSRRSTLDN